jgi:Uma2 family endonuclease
MAVRSISIEEYLGSSFEYDCEFVDGTIVERTGGEFDHSFLTAALGARLFNQCRDSGLVGLISVRVQTALRYIRVPDLAVLRAGAPRERVLTTPPLLVVEIQSPEDTLRRTSIKSAEYLAFGIEHVWVIDPDARVAYRGTANGLELVRDGELSIPGTSIRVSVQEIFADLDRV